MRSEDLLWTAVAKFMTEAERALSRISAIRRIVVQDRKWLKAAVQRRLPGLPLCFE